MVFYLKVTRFRFCYMLRNVTLISLTLRLYLEMLLNTNNPAFFGIW